MENVTFPGTLDSLEPIADFVLEAAAAAGLDKKSSYKLRLAVDEIATNIITHGYEEAGLEGNLDLSADIDESVLTVKIEDTGTPFDPYSRDLPNAEDLHKELNERALGGLGIYLTVKGVDHFSYERVDNKNCNIFVMRRIRQSTDT